MPTTLSDPARSEIRRLQQPRPRQGDGQPNRAIADYNEALRLDPKYAAPTTTAASPRRQGRLRSSPSPTTPRRSGSIRICRRLLQPRRRLKHKGDFDRAIADYTRGDPAQSERTPLPTITAASSIATRAIMTAIADFSESDPARSEIRRRLQQPRQSPSSTKATTTAPSPTTPRRSGSIRITPRLLQPRLSPARARATSTAPSPTSPRRSGSIRNPPILLQPRQRLAHKGDYDRAIADFNEAIRLDPKNFSPYNDRGALRLKRNDLDRGRFPPTSTRPFGCAPEPGALRRIAARSRRRRGMLDRASADLWRRARENNDGP